MSGQQLHVEWIQLDRIYLPWSLSLNFLLVAAIYGHEPRVQINPVFTHNCYFAGDTRIPWYPGNRNHGFVLNNSRSYGNNFFIGMLVDFIPKINIDSAIPDVYAGNEIGSTESPINARNGLLWLYLQTVNFRGFGLAAFDYRLCFPFFRPFKQFLVDLLGNQHVFI